MNHNTIHNSAVNLSDTERLEAYQKVLQALSEMDVEHIMSADAKLAHLKLDLVDELDLLAAIGAWLSGETVRWL